MQNEREDIASDKSAVSQNSSEELKKYIRSVYRTS